MLKKKSQNSPAVYSVVHGSDYALHLLQGLLLFYHFSLSVTIRSHNISREYVYKISHAAC